MNTDIRVDVSFRGHRKRRKLRRILGLGSTDYLLDLWIGVAMTKPDGDLAGWTNEDLADEAGWEGDANVFAQALKEAGFLDGEEGGYSLHDWGDHQPWVVDAPKRSEKGKKAAEARWGKAREAKGGAQEMPGACQEKAPSMHQACSEHARSMHQACSGHCSEQCPSPSPFPEEERQGEKDNARARVDRPPAPEVLPPEFPEDEPTAPVQGLKTRKASSDPACYAAFQRVVSLWPDRKEIERAKRAWNALWEAGEIIPHAIEDAILDHKARDAEWADGCHPRLWRWLENRRWTEQPKERPASVQARASPSPIRASTVAQAQIASRTAMAADVIRAREEQQHGTKDHGAAGSAGSGLPRVALPF